jgi:hypothetical protein
MKVTSLTQEGTGQVRLGKDKKKTLVALVLAGALATGLLGTAALTTLAQPTTSTHGVMTAFEHAWDNAG